MKLLQNLKDMSDTKPQIKFECVLSILLLKCLSRLFLHVLHLGNLCLRFSWQGRMEELETHGEKKRRHHSYTSVYGWMSGKVCDVQCWRVVNYM